MSVIVSSQNAAYFLSPTIRTNIDYLAFRKVENTYKRTLWNICNTKMTFSEFKAFIDENTTDYKFILYDNTSQSKDDNERIKIVKAILYDEMKVKQSKKANVDSKKDQDVSTQEPKQLRRYNPMLQMLHRSKER